ncbi:MAG: penicillin acylase family protein [Candidatus Amoebophilus sp.]
MHRIRSYSILGITLLVTLFLNLNIGKIPPIAKFLDPFQGFWQNSEAKPMQLPSNLSLAGLEDAVNIYFDENLIPHIQAKNDKDLYFAQGYITAFHRLWQMEFQTHAAAGRVAEVVGPVAINYDRLQRRKGMVYAAKNALDKVQKDPVINEIVTAYTAGVNAYISSLNYKKLPVEYKLLAYTPESWTPLKTMLVIVQMADNMSGYEQSLQHIHAFHLLGEDKFSFLFPDYDLAHEPIIPKNTPWNFKPLNLKPSSIDTKIELDNKFVPIPDSQVPNKIQALPNNGSNNWAVSGKKTVTGRPYLASDPHLNLRLPSIWYGIHLQSPSVNVAGGALPGTPGILIGFNESIAWGLTNAAWAVRDWYAIDFKDNTKAEYCYDNLLLKSQFLVEEIKVKNSESVFDTVVYTHLGPIVYDDNFTDPNHCKNLAMKWVGHHPGNEILAFYLINRAKNLQDFEHALQYHHVPVQNFAFASVQNDIAMEIAGKLPARWKNQGKSIMPGNSLACEWQCYIPISHYPKIINPKHGYISSANERATDKSYPYYYHQFYAESYRNRRINQVLSQLTKVDDKAMMRLQNDNYNLAAQENLSLLLSYLDTAQLDTPQQQAYQTLLDWNFLNEAEQVAPSIFRAWQNQLSDMLWSSFYNYQLSLQKPTFFQTMYIIKNHANSNHLELGTYQNLQALITDSFKKAVRSLQAWQVEHKKLYKWRDYHAISIPHLAQIAPFSISNLCIGGGESIVNANEGSHGVSMRIIVSLDKTPKAWFIYPGGQSGNPGSPHYTKFIDDWCKGRYINLSIVVPDASKRVSGSEITLIPQ